MKIKFLLPLSLLLVESLLWSCIFIFCSFTTTSFAFTLTTLNQQTFPFSKNNNQKQQQQQQRQQVLTPTLTNSPSLSPSLSFLFLSQDDGNNDNDFYNEEFENITSSFTDNDKNNNNDDDDNTSFMAELRQRMDQVANRETKIPIIIVDTMLPRQVLRMQVDLQQDATFGNLVRHLIEQGETPRIGMIGTARLAITGQALPLAHGVEIEIIGKPIFVEENSRNYLRVTLKAGRRFKIVGEVTTSTPASSANSKSSSSLPTKSSTGGWSEARVEYFDSSQQDEAEEVGTDPLSMARARSLALKLTKPSNNNDNENNNDDNKSLIDQWIALARENERLPGQIDQLLQDLGDCPDPIEETTEFAMWVGALINPLPGMGVAMEIRPNLLMAASAEKRIQIVHEGITSSIKHMDGTKRLF